ncbi:MAG: hypothetical protein WC714_29230 [Candidatus Obscuribacterales bacterium]|jgi:hypothetical protein
MSEFADRVRETTTTTGTGTISLSGTATTACRTFSASVTAGGAGNLSDGGATTICIEAVDAAGSPTGDWEICDSVYTVSGNTLTRGTLIGSSTGSRVSFAAGTKNVFVTAAAKKLVYVDNYRTCNFVLTLSSGVTYPTTDLTACTTLYLTPLDGNSIGLYNGTSWSMVTSSEVSLALGTLTSKRPYDVFAYNNSGVVTLEVLAWTSTSARATGLVTQDGILVKSGATTRRYLGTLHACGNQTATVTMTIAAPGVITYTAHGLFPNAPVVFTTTGALPTGLTAGTTYYVCPFSTSATAAMTADTFMVASTVGGTPITTSGSQSGTHTCTVGTYTEDSQQNRLLFNYYNRSPKTMSKVLGVANWTYSTATPRQSNADTSNALNFVIGINNSVVAFEHFSVASNSSSTFTDGALGYDAATAYSQNSRAYIYQPATVIGSGLAALMLSPAIGLHYISAIEIPSGTGTQTWNYNSQIRGLINQ